MATWLYLILVVVAVLAIAGLLAGGVFTIVLIPIVAIALVSALVFSIMSRAAKPHEESSDSAPPLPHSPPSGSGHAPTSAEGLADARRVEQ